MVKCYSCEKPAIYEVHGLNDGRTVQYCHDCAAWPRIAQLKSENAEVRRKGHSQSIITGQAQCIDEITAEVARIKRQRDGLDDDLSAAQAENADLKRKLAAAEAATTALPECGFGDYFQCTRPKGHDGQHESAREGRLTVVMPDDPLTTLCKEIEAELVCAEPDCGGGLRTQVTLVDAESLARTDCTQCGYFAAMELGFSFDRLEEKHAWKRRDKSETPAGGAGSGGRSTVIIGEDDNAPSGGGSAPDFEAAVITRKAIESEMHRPMPANKLGFWGSEPEREAHDVDGKPLSKIGDVPSVRVFDVWDPEGQA